ncbi:MAG: hypothetical protein ACPGSD_15320 [Flavobacteriales bacterium]
MNTLLKRKVLTITVLTILSIGAYSISSGLATPLLHKGEQAQVLSKLSIGTPSANSLLTVKSSDNDARLKLLPDIESDKSLLLHTNSLSLGSIRVGDGLSSSSIGGLSEAELEGLFGVGTNENNWEKSLRYPTAKTGSDITAVAPKQSINVHGKIVMEGLKAPNTAAETDQLCVAPNGTLTRCSTSSGYKWVATGFSSCLDDQSVINNTISSLANYQNPQCTSVIIDTGVTVESGSGGLGSFNTFESALDKLKSQKAHAAIVSQGVDIGNGEVLCNPATPASVYSGYSGKKVQSFVCKSLNSCEIVADSFCADSVGAKPVYEASCVVPATDTGGGCQDGCYLNADNLCVQTADTVDTGSGGSCIAQNFPWLAPGSGSSCPGTNFDGSWSPDYPYCASLQTESQCDAVGVPGAGADDCCIWSE